VKDLLFFAGETEEDLVVGLAKALVRLSRNTRPDSAISMAVADSFFPALSPFGNGGMKLYAEQYGERDTEELDRRLGYAFKKQLSSFRRDAVVHFYIDLINNSGAENHSDPLNQGLVRKRCLFLLLTGFFHICPHENFLSCDRIHEKGICTRTG